CCCCCCCRRRHLHQDRRRRWNSYRRCLRHRNRRRRRRRRYRCCCCRRRHLNQHHRAAAAGGRPNPRPHQLLVLPPSRPALFLRVAPPRDCSRCCGRCRLLVPSSTLAPGVAVPRWLLPVGRRRRHRRACPQAVPALLQDLQPLWCSVAP
ncbi:unnamed protein product, partial [Ectocarpus sp. 12 AP-2014]